MQKFLRSIYSTIISAVRGEKAANRKIFVRPLTVNTKMLIAIAGILGPLIFIAADVTLGLLNPGYSFVKSSISSLALADFGWIQTLGFMAIGILVVIFIFGLYFYIKGARGFRLGIAVMIIFAFGLLAVGAFRADLPTSQATFEGLIHGIAAKLVFWLFPAGVLLISPSLRQEPYWRPLFFYSLAASIFAIGFMANSLRMPADFPWFGLFERILVADEVLWVLVMGIWLLRQSILEKKELRKSL